MEPSIGAAGAGDDYPGGMRAMSDRPDRGFLRGARRPGPLSDAFPSHRAGGLNGPPRGVVVVADAKTGKAAKPRATPKVVGWELSVYG